MLAILCSGQLLQAQEWEKQAFFNTQAHVIRTSERILFRPGVEFSKGFHHLKIAPSFRLYSSEAGYNPGKFQITGAMGAYQFSVPTVLDFLRFYFQYEANYQLYRNDWQGNFYDPAATSYRFVKYETSENFIANNLGMGFELLLGQHFTLAIDVAEGYYFSSVRVKNLPSDLQRVENFDFREYEDQGWILSASFVIGYRF